MKTPFLLIVICCISLTFTQEKHQKYWIYFTAKEAKQYSALLSPSAVAATAGITERALRRRSKVSQTISTDDLPVSELYLSQLKERGIVIENTSRWFNAVSVYCTKTQREMIQALPFVRTVEPVVVFKRRELPKSDAPVQLFSKQLSSKFSYGSSETQMDLINAVAVHNIGISGRGVLVGMLDTGFRWKMHEAMKNMKVIAEYDFIQKDSITANESGDSGSQDSHGTSTMSLVGGYKDGKLISPAFNAQFILGKTEYVPSETNIEEDNWVAGIEWMEALGVDVVSCSLGYSEFDAGQKSYVYADMNGKTTITTIAASMAMRKGVVVVNAMGNEAQFSWHYMIAPADADSIVSVGAVSSNGNVASFSSVGPTSDGRTKPDVSAQGVSTYAALSGGSYSSAFGGTSAATPFVAGVAAMILSARPELTPVQVRDALRTTANNANNPDNSIGWGIINAYNAVLHYGMVISTDPAVAITTDSSLSVGMYVVSNTRIFKDSVRLFYTLDSGKTFTPLAMTLTEVLDASTNSGKYITEIPKSEQTPKFYVRAIDATKISRTSPFTAPLQLYDATVGTTEAPPGSTIPLAFGLQQNFPNPFNPSTTISYDLPHSGFVSLTVFDVLGREVRKLVNETQLPNHYAVSFNGAALSSGVYFYQLKMKDFVETKRMMLVK